MKLLATIKAEGILTDLLGTDLAKNAALISIQDFLAPGAGLARDHHREVGLHQAGEDAVDLLHRRGAADERDVVVDVGPRLEPLRFRR